MMAKYRMVRTEFWKNPIVLEEMSAEDKYFWLVDSNPYHFLGGDVIKTNQEGDKCKHKLPCFSKLTRSNDHEILTRLPVSNLKNGWSK